MKIKNVLCGYCKKEAVYSPLKDMEVHEVKVYFCHSCNAEYLFWQDGSLASQSLYVTINNKMYRWTEGAGIYQLWYVKTPGEPGVRINQNMESIKAFRFDNYPVITPENIEQKVKIMLLMS